MMEELLVMLKIPVVAAISLFLIAYLTYFERKAMAWMQRRKGINTTGWFGILQPVADAIKSLCKELAVPKGADKVLFMLSPILVFTSAMLGFSLIPFAKGFVVADFRFSMLTFVIILGMHFTGLIMAGVFSSSNYARISAQRIVMQFISSELILMAVFLNIILSTGSLNFEEIIAAQSGMWNIIPHFPLFVCFMIMMLMDTSRTPFDISQAESEIVSGFQVEYSGLAFSYFMFAEYGFMLLFSALGTVLFLGGYQGLGEGIIPSFMSFGIKAMALCFIFIWVRVSMPRYKKEQMLEISFKYVTPLCFLWLAAQAGMEAVLK